MKDTIKLINMNSPEDINIGEKSYLCAEGRKCYTTKILAIRYSGNIINEIESENTIYVCI